MPSDATTVPAGAAPAPAHSTAWLVHDLRMLAAVGTAGMVVGFVVGGVGGRLAMMLLARLNPQATGRISDDGFRIGQFSLGDTLGLVAIATVIGVLGGLVFLVVRSLRFGPSWFRSASVVVGAAVVVGAMLVHTDGIDFHVLEPTWLAIALFVALPGLFAYAIMHLGDRWLRDDAWFVRGRSGWWLGLAPLALLGPLAVLILIGLTARAAYQLTPVRRVLSPRVLAIVTRVALIGVFAVMLVDLGRETATLLG